MLSKKLIYIFVISCVCFYADRLNVVKVGIIMPASKNTHDRQKMFTTFIQHMKCL